MTKLAPSLINSATPAASAGLFPPTPTFLAGGPHPGNNLAHHPPHLGHRRESHALAQVRGRDVQHVGPRDRQDLVQVVHRLHPSSTMGITSNCEFTQLVDSSRVTPMP